MTRRSIPILIASPDLGPLAPKFACDDRDRGVARGRGAAPTHSSTQCEDAATKASRDAARAADTARFTNQAPCPRRSDRKEGSLVPKKLATRVEETVSELLEAIEN